MLRLNINMTWHKENPTELVDPTVSDVLVPILLHPPGRHFPIWIYLGAGPTTLGFIPR